MNGESCPDCGRESTHVPVPGRPGRVECAVCHASWELDEPRPGTGSSVGEELPQWQAARLAALLAAVAGVPVSDAERRSLAWLCGFEDHTVVHLGAVIRRARARSVATSKQAARDQLETERLRRQLSETCDDMDDLDDRYQRQLVDLCECAGIDPDEDPYAALLAHLRGREPGGGRSA